MMNLILVLVCVISSHYLLMFLDSKFRKNAKIKAINLAYKSFDEFKILSLEEIKNLDDSPFNLNEIEPDFTPHTNLFNARFYFKLIVQKESEIFTKWVYMFYFLNFRINFKII